MSRLMQLVLDLFDSPAIEGPQPPAETLPQVLPRACYVHPRASRRIQLGHTDVAYAFRRAKRRTIGMAVGPDGLEVSAPRWVSVGEVELALREKADWIARKLVEMDERQQQLGAARIDWRDGVVIPYLGNDLQVVLDSTQALKKGAAHLDGAVLRLGLPMHADAAQIRDAAQAWLMRQAKVLFTQRLDHFAPQLQVQWRKLSLSSAATRWGSAGADGGIRLNWRLIHHKLDIIDYVVAHELSHLRVMNHSPQFWETVESVVPDYAKRRRVLREQMLPPWG
ncbi:MAG: M48 family peptidase [Betaproteobacteria bacterium]|jgi:predicted metal-dependent hydrolase|nr:M48 family peptidase [Betaproteobacteria bacterium]